MRHVAGDGREWRWRGRVSASGAAVGAADTQGDRRGTAPLVTRIHQRTSVLTQNEPYLNTDTVTVQIVQHNVGLWIAHRGFESVPTQIKLYFTG